MNAVEQITNKMNIHPVDAATMYIIKINMSKSKLSADEIVAIANKVAGLDEQTYNAVGEIMHAVTGRQVFIYGNGSRTYVKMATARSVARAQERGTLIRVIC